MTALMKIFRKLKQERGLFSQPATSGWVSGKALDLVAERNSGTDEPVAPVIAAFDQAGHVPSMTAGFVFN